MALGNLLHPLPADYPDYLASPKPERVAVRGRGWLLLGLMLFCLVLRLPMAARLPAINPDAVLYIESAQDFEAGNYREAFEGFRLNVYPIVLVGLHRLGLDWETGGMAWGIAISCLVVLPLYGWARRQFDERVALVACVLYAVQPKLILWSPEIMRDSTFWFLFALSLYCLWRAVVEVRPILYAAAGMAITLATLTRFEGVFLLIPFVLWTFWRYRALGECRGRLAMGALLCVFAFPALLLLANLIWLYGRADWVLPRLEPLVRVQAFLQSLAGESPPTAVDPCLPPPGSKISLARMVRVFFPVMTRGLSPIFALLMFGGMWHWRRLWMRRDNQALFYTCMVIVAAIWIHLWYDRVICPRYALSIVLMATIFASLGLLALTERLLWLAGWFHPGPKARWLVAMTPLLVTAVVGFSSAMTSEQTYFANRRMARDLGQWVRQEIGPDPVIVGPTLVTPIASHYVDGGKYCTFRTDTGDEQTILSLVEQHHPDLLLLRPTKSMSAEQCQALADRLQQQGFAPADFSFPPETGRHFRLLRRADSASLARQPATTMR